MKHPKKYDSSPETRKRMANVKLKNGTAESIIAKELWHSGFRYRKNDKRLPGSPDIAILRYRIAVFIDGEFWHGKDWAQKKERLKSNREYWIEKIEENMARDIRVDRELEALGWTPIHFWSKDATKHTNQCLSEIIELIASNIDN